MVDDTNNGVLTLFALETNIYIRFFCTSHSLINIRILHHLSITTALSLYIISIWVIKIQCLLIISYAIFLQFLIKILKVHLQILGQQGLIYQVYVVDFYETIYIYSPSISNGSHFIHQPPVVL